MSKSEATLGLLNPDFTVKKTNRRRNTGCQFFIMGIATTLSVASLAIAIYQAASSHRTVHITSEHGAKAWPLPPPHEEVTKVARYVVHTSEWASIATISTALPIEGFPFANIISISDGPVNESSGTPYMYMTRMDLSGKDLLKDARATLSFSEAQSDYCKNQGYDPEDPRCARVLLSGQIIELKRGTAEASLAQNALFSRHPVMATWPAGHNFFFAKLNITHIYVLDFFGGAFEADVDEYFKTDPFA